MQGAQTWSIAPARPTVGDTVILSRLLPGPPGVRARPQPLGPSSLLEPLGDPKVERAGSTLVLSYPVALFEAGQLELPMPPVELLYSDGTAELILGDTARILVASVLPELDSLPDARPSLGPVLREVKQPWPAVWLGLAALGAGGLWGWLRRRGRRPLSGAEPAPVATSPPLERWAAAGEVRAVATVVYHELRQTMAQLEPRLNPGADEAELLLQVRDFRPEWPADEIAGLLRELERARFSPAVGYDVLELAERSGILCRELRLLESAPDVRAT